MIARPALSAWIRRPVAVAVLCALLLAALLSGGLVVARAVDGTPVADSTASTAPDGGNGDDNVAVAVNRTDGRDAYALRLKVVITNDERVDAGNAAVAVSSCSDCRTVAVALEGVLLTGNPEVVSPQNIALAINQGCSGCETLAAAYQTVISTGGRVRMTGAGRAAIGNLRRQLNTLRTRDLPFAELVAEIDRIADEFAAVLRTGVVPIGRPSSPSPSAAADAASSAEPAAVPSPDGSPTADQPVQSPSPDSAGSPSPEPSPEPSVQESPPA